MQSDSIKLGADIGVAVGPVGAGAEAATQNLSADIVSFSRSQGAYAGVSLEGSVVAVRKDWNTAYYQKRVTPLEILVFQNVSNPQARALIADASRAAR